MVISIVMEIKYDVGVLCNFSQTMFTVLSKNSKELLYLE